MKYRGIMFICAHFLIASYLSASDVKDSVQSDQSKLFYSVYHFPQAQQLAESFGNQPGAGTFQHYKIFYPLIAAFANQKLTNDALTQLVKTTVEKNLVVQCADGSERTGFLDSPFHKELLEYVALCLKICAERHEKIVRPVETTEGTPRRQQRRSRSRNCLSPLTNCFRRLAIRRRSDPVGISSVPLTLINPEYSHLEGEN